MHSESLMGKKERILCFCSGKPSAAHWWMKVKADRDERPSYAAMLAAQDVAQEMQGAGDYCLHIKLRARRE